MRHLALAALLATPLAFAAPPTAFGQAPETAIKGERVVRAELVQIRAIVESTNAVERSLVLNVGADGFRTVRVGPEVQNFPQIQPGDRVEVDLYDEVALVLARNAPQQPTVAEAVTLAPLGARPAMKDVRVSTTTSRVMAIDSGTRRVTLRRQDGSLFLVRAPDDIDLSRVAVGDDVVAVHTEAMAVEVRKP